MSNPAITDVKSIKLVTSRPVNEHQVEVRPGESCSEVLEKAGLSANDYMALKPSDQSPFRLDEEVFPHVGDGSKVHLTMHSEVGRA